MEPHPNQETALLRRLFDAAVGAAQPATCVPPHLPFTPPGRTLVIGAGKAAAAMARAVEQAWAGPLEGLVITRYGHGVPCDRIEVVEAAHPVPDAAGVAATDRMLSLAEGCSAEDLVICLISGGGSALMVRPRPPLTLADKQAATGALLRSGATIAEVNCVRRHLSAVKGGRLAAACHPARIVTLAISDVPGDRPGDIASGPTVGDGTTPAEALAILDRYGVAASEAVRHVLADPTVTTVAPDDQRLARADFRLVATPQASLEAAARAAREAGVTPHILGDALEGEARHLATALGGIARQVAARAQPFAPPCVLLSGGETTVTVRGDGTGGRNVEFALALALHLDGLPGVHALAADTDGVDGAAEVAGAVIGPDTLARARTLGLDPAEMLARNDAHPFFAALGDGVVTGPTHTNVNDFRAILVTGRGAGSVP